MVREVLGVLDGGVEGAYKPDWVELDVFLRSSKTLESLGIYGQGQSVGCEPGKIMYLYFEAVEEIDASCKFEAHENQRYKLGSYRCDARDLCSVSYKVIYWNEGHIPGRASEGLLAMVPCSCRECRRQQRCFRAQCAQRNCSM